jgi:hypothetical protein
MDTAKYTMFGDGLLTDDEARAIFLYSCEWSPREWSAYFLVNFGLRDKDRSKVLPFIPFIKLLCNAVSKVLLFLYAKKQGVCFALEMNSFRLVSQFF